MLLFDTDRFREIAQTLSRNRSRTFLTGFGVFWGVFMLLAMAGGGQGLKEILARNFEGFATNSLIMFADNTGKPYKGFRKERRWSMNYRDVDRLKNCIPELDIVTPMVSSWGSKITYGNQQISGSLKGVRADYCKIEEPILRYGRYLNEPDILHERKVCVIGKKIYSTLFPEGGDPCGKFIRVGSIYYRVIGVDWSEGNMSINGNAAESLLVPITVMRKAFNFGDNVHLLCMTARPGVKMKQLEPRIRQVIARAHYIDPTDTKAMFILNTELMFGIMDTLFDGVNILIWLIGLGTILAGIIGVSNIMMVTVRERTVEIGIRRAIGATPRMILSQIISESIILTMVAGFLGIVLAVGLLALGDKLAFKDGIQTAHFQVSFLMAVLSALMLTVLGVLAGLAPASRAMQIKPVDAMRDE